MEDLLARVERPSRYLGTEVGAIKKDPAAVRVRVALAYPDLYEIGMSNTGLHILYYMLNEAADVAAERVYLPAPDMVKLLQQDGRPLTTLESRLPLSEVDILGIQIPHELSYANIVKMIRLAGIPLWASARRDDDPIVLGGGPGVFGAEPVAPFYDAMLLGDAEEALWDVVEAVRDLRARGASRHELLTRLAGITGVYVPSFYDVRYHDDGRVAAIEPKHGAPRLVIKALVEDLEGAYYPKSAVVPYAETVHNRLPVEVMRGCTVGCRFCQAGIIYRPLRERSPKRILDLAKCGLGATGFEDISLLSLDTGDYTLIDPLTKQLLEETADKRVALSLPSLRAGSLTDDVIHDISRVRRTSFTIAPEAGTQRLRDVINKNISDEEVLETVERVARNGWSDIKMYFMVGFPTETQQDLDGLVDLVTRCRDLGRRFVRRFECTASIGTLVPKPHTPFQWDVQLSMEESARRVRYVARELKARKIGCKFHDPLHSFMEGIFSRGDRRLAPVVAAAEARGCGMESWSDKLQADTWFQVLEEHGLRPEWYLRNRTYDEVLPWDHLSSRVSKKYLMGDRLKVDRLANPTTFDCRDDLCAGCSVCFTDDVRNRLAKYDPDPFGDKRPLPLAITSRAVVGHGVQRQLESMSQRGAPAPDGAGEDRRLPSARPLPVAELGPEGGAEPRLPGANVRSGAKRDQAAKAGSDAVEAKRRRKRPPQPGDRRWHVTPGAPGAPGPAVVFKEAVGKDDDIELARLQAALDAEALADEERRAQREAERAAARSERLANAGPTPELRLDGVPVSHYRVTYARTGLLRWLSHREVMRTFYRLVQRSGLPLRYTEGYHPKPRLSFGPPLPVGAESVAEELDLYLVDELPAEQVAASLAAIMATAPGLSLQGVARAHGKSAHAERLGGRWSVALDELGVTEEAGRALVLRWADPTVELFALVDRPDRPTRKVDLRGFVSGVAVEDGRLSFEVRQSSDDGPDRGSAKPAEIVGALLDVPVDRARAACFRLVAAIRRPAKAVVVAGPVEVEVHTEDQGDLDLGPGDDA